MARWILLLLTAAMFINTGTRAEERRREEHRRKDGDKKDGDKKDGDAKDANTLEGTLSSKGDNWIEVKQDNSDKVAKFIPQWVGGNDGGFNKETLEKIGKLKVGSRVRVVYKQDEHLRVIDVKTIDGDKKEGGDHKDGDKKEGDKKDGDKKEGGDRK